MTPSYRSKFIPLVQDNVLDILHMADIHRRNATLPVQEPVISGINKVMAKIGYQLLTLPRFKERERKEIQSGLYLNLCDLKERVKILGNPVILLPFRAGSEKAKTINDVFKTYAVGKEEVCPNGMKAPPGFSFREAAYSKDYKAQGYKINLNIRNILQQADNDIYIGGLWDIDKALVNQWFQEVNGQSLKIRAMNCGRTPRLV